MAADKEKVLTLILTAIDELNEMRDEEDRIEAAISSQLYGEVSSLDSLGLVNLIVIAEEKIEETFNVMLTLADDKAMSLRNSPFRSVDTLAEYILLRLAEEI